MWEDNDVITTYGEKIVGTLIYANRLNKKRNASIE